MFDYMWLSCVFMLLSAQFVFGNDTICEMKGNSVKKLEVAVELLNEVKESLVCPSTKPPEKPMDCSEVLFNGHNISGVYTLWPMNRVLTTESVKAYCDMDTEGGGWTVIQRRGNFGKPVDYFYKTWEEYKKGFGLLSEDFWLGNDVIYAFSNQKLYSVRFDLTDYSGTKAHAVYNKFWIDDEDRSYRLHISGYHGNADPCPKPPERPMDCTEVLLNGHNTSGVYTLWPKSRILSCETVKAYCDMDTDGGGWTVIQRRGNFSRPEDYFFKNWIEYKRGFGKLNEDFWFGDGMAYHNNEKFSTKDRKNENTNSTGCANERKGAWWYYACGIVNLNGLYIRNLSNSTGVL
ncbi:techylectin-5A-like isoform X2 [Stegodyphus dumicola]|uniref:techylectin-5A-like isoform X2 n=1 Tax=Stegodyphus dumicola TaxID=202533 RepID=UPI0015A88303|nr:techylectin-5A-like isoform X2 [Stegodyphus dumicola]